MLSLIVANVRRRTARTALTAAGIAVGVAAIVALLGLSAGMTRSAGQLVHLGRADLGLFQSGAADPTASEMPLSLLPRLRAQPEVRDATPIQLVLDAVKASPSSIILGLEPSGFVASMMVYTEGTGIRSGAVAVGDLLARELHLHAGGRIRLLGRTFQVAGIVHTGIQFEDYGIVATLRDAQQLAGRTTGEATTIAVRLSPQTTAAAGARQLRRTFPGVEVITTAGEAARAGANGALISKGVLFIVVLALIIGALAVANTMLAAVLERRRELVLLATIGWSPSQLASLVLGEAVAVSVIGSVVGVGLGWMAAGLLPAALGLQSFISPEIGAWVLGRGLLIGITIGVIGGIYPVWRVTRVWSAAGLAPA